MVEQNDHPTLYLDKILLLDDADTGLAEAEKEVIRLNEPDVELYAWINNDEASDYAGVGRIKAVCGRTKSSLTKGPSRHNSVVETAEVN